MLTLKVLIVISFILLCLTLLEFQHRVALQTVRKRKWNRIMKNSVRGPLSLKSLEEEHLPMSEVSGTIRDIVNALQVLQNEYFEPWIGTWPDANDWTRAVHGTHMSAALNAITRHPDYIPSDSPFGSISENTVGGYFNHLTSFYFGENAFSLRSQAYDDMQWVVLGWLEAIKIAKLHSDLHFPGHGNEESVWHGKDYIPAFAHRARVFWDLASEGWETTLCGGGMLWSPYGIPYKNAITNELYITTSVNMYLHFPGDDNDFPFLHEEYKSKANHVSKVREHDRKYLEAAVTAYSWLNSSGMINAQGLYADGYHIKGWRGGRNPSNGTGRCDIRDEKVYTYNQGVILSGQRGLWEATGNQIYLEEGHALIRNVIAATGYYKKGPQNRHRWAGLGRNGILEDTCDSSSSCSQNGQAFKGIFFHHFTTFCEPLPVGKDGPIFHRADKTLATLHRDSCEEYSPWVARNARAALGTRDSDGKFGEWWTVGLDDFNNAPGSWKFDTPKIGTDYRNRGLPVDPIWRAAGDESTLIGTDSPVTIERSGSYLPNDRGRGRTVETQSGGLAVLYALFRVVELQRGLQNKENMEL